MSGSSPRMRGSLFATIHAREVMGIIPAYAGLTILPLSSLSHSWDHPRVCGAHCQPFYDSHICPGSSPRMRGSLEKDILNDMKFGIIPAYAGLTFALTMRVYSTWDHPRVCGAHYYSRNGKVNFPGSSPRMRGSRMLRTNSTMITGIIPAYAGLTCS